MKVKRERSGDVHILRLKGALMGGPEADEIRGCLLLAMEEGGRKLLIDLHDVPWINSTGLGILVSCLVSAQNREATLKLMRLSDRVGSVFITMKLNMAFEMFAKEEEAIASFGAPQVS